MFYAFNEHEIHVNCQVVPNPDVSGIGVRLALYVQAFVMIILSLFKTTPGAILLANITNQVTALALIAATYFDPSVDIPHTLIASQFAVLFSVIRITPADLPARFPTTRVALKTMMRLWFIDRIFRICLLIFNFSIWKTIIKIQKANICAIGPGEWFFFWHNIDLSTPNAACRMAFIYCILDIAWECFQYLSGAIMFWAQDRAGISILKDYTYWDPRIWLVAEIIRCSPSRKSFAKKSQFRRNWLWRCSFVRKCFLLIYVLESTEKIVQRNNLIGDNYWAFGQIFAMVNMFTLLGLLIGHFIPPTIDFSVMRLFLRIIAPFFCICIGQGVLALTCFVILSSSSLRYSVSDIIMYVLAMLAWVTWIISLLICFYPPFRKRYQRSRFPLKIASTVIKVPYRSISRSLRYTLSNDELPPEEDREIEALQRECAKADAPLLWKERLANAYERKGDLARAAMEWERISNLLPDEWWPRYQLANTYERLGDLEGAICVWERLVIGSNFNAPCENWWENRLTRAYMLEDGAQAVMAGWKSLVEIFPERPTLLRCLAKEHNRRGDWDEVIAIYTKVVALCPGQVEPMIDLAEAYYCKGDLKTACGMLRAVFDENPRNKIVDKRLVSTYLRFLDGWICCYDCKEKFTFSRDWHFCSDCDPYVGGLPQRVLDAITKNLLSDPFKYQNTQAVFILNC